MLNSKLHCLNFVLIPLIWLISIFINNNCYSYLLILSASSISLILLCSQIHWRSLFWFSLGLLPALIAMFISSYLFIDPNKATHDSLILNSITLTIRLYSLSVISFAFIYHMPKDTLILSLAQRKILPVKLAFALLAVFNAFSYLKGEFKRILIAYQMRFQKSGFSPKLLLPLLVSAARYAHTLSISMYNRGLNQKRSYFQKEKPFSFYDYVFIAINAIASFIIFYSLSQNSLNS